MNRFFRLKFITFLVVSIVFFSICFFTISDYNVNWDEPSHFARGQAYLHYFLSGKTNYKDLPGYEKFWSYITSTKKPLAGSPRYSIYQNTRDMEHFLKIDNGHPPLNGILAAFTNYIFYQKLNVLGDIQSYHLFIIFISSLLVIFLGYVMSREYGLFASIVSTLSLITYPIFFGETHNNIKDPVETAFFTFTLLICFYAIKERKRALGLVASICAGFALSTKFNIFTAPFILIIWYIGSLRYAKRNSESRFLASVFLRILFILLCLAIPIFIFFISWPFLWQNPIVNAFKIFHYYEGIGTDAINQPSYSFGLLNIYPILWILFTTPLITLALSFLGMLYILRNLKSEMPKVSFLAFVWFFITVGRVSISKFSIYGGVRQIMEYIPAMAILAGVGANYVILQLAKIKNFDINRLLLRRVLQVIVLLLFVPIVLKLIQLHPNEIVYFNPLIGGLQGAKQRNLPSWGLTLGNGYKKGIDWINQNAEKNARVALVLYPAPTVPFILFRPDISYSNGFWSGEEKQGEYLIETIWSDWKRVYFYPAEYVDRVLIPVYEVKADNVVIARVWKNDVAHTRKEFQKKGALDVSLVSYKQGDNNISLSLRETTKLLNIEINFTDTSCSPMQGGYVLLSEGNSGWVRLDQAIVEPYIGLGKLSYPVAGWKARAIEIHFTPSPSCPLQISTVNILKAL